MLALRQQLRKVDLSQQPPGITEESERRGAQALFDMIRQSKANEGDGLIDRKQLSSLLSTFGVGNNPGLVNQVFEAFAEDESNTLTFEAFCDFLATLRVSKEQGAIFVNAEEVPYDEATLRVLFDGATSLEKIERTAALSIVTEHVGNKGGGKLSCLEELADKIGGGAGTKAFDFDAFSALIISARDIANGRDPSDTMDTYFTCKQVWSRSRDRLMRVTRTTVLHIFRTNNLTLDQATELARDVLRVLLPARSSDDDVLEAEVESKARVAVVNELDSMLTEVTRPVLGKFKDARPIIARGANINLRIVDKPPHEPILLRAICMSHFDMATILLDAGADVHAVDDEGATALMRLVTTPNPALKLLKRLLTEAGGSLVNRAKHDGATALHLAATFGRTLAITQLLENGADVSCQMTDGTTALMRAAQMDFPGAVELLCQANADLNVTNQAGRNAIDLAILADRSEKVVDILKFRGAIPSQGALASKKQVEKGKNVARPPDVAKRTADSSNLTSPLARSRKQAPRRNA